MIRLESEVAGDERMAWIVSVGLVGLVCALTRSFVINAHAIKRDMNRRFEDIRKRLERDANALVDELLESDQAHTAGPR